MNRLLCPLIFLTVMLGACGQSSLPVAPAVVGAVQTSQPSSGDVSKTKAPAISVTAAVLSENGTGSATLRLAGVGASSLRAQAADISIESLPEGVHLQVQPPGTGPDGLTWLLTLQASHAAAPGDVRLGVRLNGEVVRVQVPVLRSLVVPLPSLRGTSPAGVAAGTVACGHDLLVYAPVNAPLEMRSRLLLAGPDGSVRPYALPLTPSEGVTSALCDPGGLIWLTLRGDEAQGGVIASFSPQTGTLRRFGVGAAADTLNDLTRTPDGRLWFVQYKRDRLGEFDPKTGEVTTHPVSENAENLRVGHDGALYYSQFYARPAVVRHDPVSGSSRVLSIGTSGRSLPRASVQMGTFVYAVDVWNHALTRLDLGGGAAFQIGLPAGAVPGELTLAADGTLWLADAVNHLLYRLAPGQLEAVSVPLPGDRRDGPRALSVAADGRLWFESAGSLIGLH